MKSLIPVRDVAEILGVHPATVWRKAARGDLPKPIKVAGLTRWRRAEIDALIEAARAEGQEAA